MMSSLEGPVWNLPGHLGLFISSAPSPVLARRTMERATTSLHSGSEGVGGQGIGL